MVQQKFEDCCIVFRRHKGSAVRMDEDEHEDLARREELEEMARRLPCALALR